VRLQNGRLHRLLRQDEGQDLVEYALLILFIVLASIAAWETIEFALGAAYNRYDDSLWGLFWSTPGS